jgi:hypothetical protein
MLKFLNKARSESKNLGPCNVLRPTFPNKSHPGSRQEPPASCAAPLQTLPGDVFGKRGSGSSETPPVPWNQYPVVVLGSPDRVPALTGPIRSGRHGPVSLDAWQELRLGVKGNPLEKFVVPFNSQPPMSKSAALPTFPAYFFPWPKGNW